MADDHQDAEKEKLAAAFVKQNAAHAGRAPQWVHDLIDWLWPTKRK